MKTNESLLELHFALNSSIEQGELLLSKLILEKDDTSKTQLMAMVHHQIEVLSFLTNYYDTQCVNYIFELMSDEEKKSLVESTIKRIKEDNILHRANYVLSKLDRISNPLPNSSQDEPTMSGDE